MTKRKCGACGRDPAAGFACVTYKGETTFYCHGDEDESPTCYERWSAPNGWRGALWDVISLTPDYMARRASGS